MRVRSILAAAQMAEVRIAQKTPLQNSKYKFQITEAVVII